MRSRLGKPVASGDDVTTTVRNPKRKPLGRRIIMHTDSTAVVAEGSNRTATTTAVTVTNTGAGDLRNLLRRRKTSTDDVDNICVPQSAAAARISQHNHNHNDSDGNDVIEAQLTTDRSRSVKDRLSLVSRRDGQLGIKRRVRIERRDSPPPSLALSHPDDNDVIGNNSLLSRHKQRAVSAAAWDADGDDMRDDVDDVSGGESPAADLRSELRLLTAGRRRRGGGRRQIRVSSSLETGDVMDTRDRRKPEVKLSVAQRSQPEADIVVPVKRIKLKRDKPKPEG